MRNGRNSQFTVYAAAAAGVALAVGARRLLDPALGDYYPFATLYFAVLLAAAHGGFLPALASAFFGTLAADYFLVPPRGQFGEKGAVQHAGLALSLATGTGIAWLGGTMRAERLRIDRVRDRERLQRERLEVTLHSIGDGVIATDAAGAVTFLNPVAQQLTGWSPEEAAGQPLETVFAIVREGSREPAENPARRALHAGTAAGLVHGTLLVARNGAERPIDDSAAPIRDGFGGVAGAVLVFRDVSERRREEAVRAEQLKLAALRAEVATALAANPEKAAALQAVCAALVANLDMAFARVWTMDEAGKTLILKASAGLYTHLDGPHSRVAVGQFKIGRIAYSRKAHLTNAVPDDPNIGDREWARREGMVGFAGYPLVVEGRVIGVLAMFARSRITEGVLGDLAPLADAVAQFVDRKQAEIRFARRADLDRRVLESIGDAVVAADGRGCVALLNAAAEALTGWPNAEAAGRPLGEIVRWEDEPADESAGAAPDSVYGGLPGPRFRRALLVARDGSRHPVEVGSAPVRDDSAGTVFILRDAALKRQQERQAEESERQFGTLAESIPQLAWMANPDGDIFWYNRRWYDYTGTTFEQMQGWGWQSVHDPAVLPRVVEAWTASVAAGEPFEMVFPLKGADGKYREFLTRVIPVRDRRGRVTRWFGSNTDIHEQVQTEERLRRLAADLSESDRRKDEFLATLAHELRNPLAPIRNGLQILRTAGTDGRVVERARTMMDRQMNHMVRLVDDLLDLSRLTLDKLELRRQEVDLAEVLHGALEASRPLIEAGGHALDARIPAEPMVLNADATRLVQVVSNLLNNAAKYSERGSRIVLTAGVESGSREAFVTVADAGIGIDAAQLPRIFEMFSQVESPLKRTHGGLGIGLTLVKRLVEMHGGRVEVRSEGPGRGSEFTVRLPLVSKPAPPPVPKEATGGPARASLRILIVDDNRDAADTLAMMLELNGHSVRAAYDGEEAVAASEAFQPEVILLDIGLPKLNGYEACRRIRDRGRGQAVVIIACTGWGQAEDKQRARDAGFDRHLVKPVDPEALEKVLAEWS